MRPINCQYLYRKSPQNDYFAQNFSDVQKYVGLLINRRLTHAISMLKKFAIKIFNVLIACVN